MAGGRPDPEMREVTLQDGTVQRVGLASPSLAYSLLVSENDGAVFLDVRDNISFDKSHLFGSRWVNVQAVTAAAQVAMELPSLEQQLQQKGVTASNSSPSASAGKADELTVLRSRCTLRTVVIVSDQNPALQDEAVLGALRLLHLLKARPKGHPLVLRGGISNFRKRFAFCLRRHGEEAKIPLPACPAELVPVGLPGAPQMAVYVGSERCLHEAGAEKIFAALGIKTVITTGALQWKSSKCKVIRVPAPVDDLVGLAVSACEKLVRQSCPSLVCGPAAAVVGALAVAEALSGTLGSAEEVEAHVKLRLPWAEFDAIAQSAIARAVAKARGDRVLPPLAVADVELIEAEAPRVSSPVAANAASPMHTTAPAASSAKAAPTYVEELVTKLQKRDRRKAEVALKTVRAAFNHILEKPTEEKYRRLKGSNERVKREVLAHEEVVRLFRLAGFVNDGEDLVLPPPTPLQGLRDILAQLPAAK